MGSYYRLRRSGVHFFAFGGGIVLVVVLPTAVGVSLFWLFGRFYSYWSISVAPMRGGTHFLCRRKESKQRKRAQTANS
jgi:hypothetical protein